MITFSNQDMERLTILLSDAYGKIPENGFCKEIASSKEDEVILILKAYAFNMPTLKRKNKTKPLDTTTIVKNAKFEIGEKFDALKEVKNDFALGLKEAKDVIDAACTEKGVLVKSQNRCAALCTILQKHGTYEIESGENKKTKVSL